MDNTIYVNIHKAFAYMRNNPTAVPEIVHQPIFCQQRQASPPIHPKTCIFTWSFIFTSTSSMTTLSHHNFTKVSHIWNKNYLLIQLPILLNISFPAFSLVLQDAVSIQMSLSLWKTGCLKGGMLQFCGLDLEKRWLVRERKQVISWIWM